MNPCPDCTFENEMGSAFCIQCGHDFTAAPKSIPADIRAADHATEDPCESDNEITGQDPVDSPKDDAASSEEETPEDTTNDEGKVDHTADCEGESENADEGETEGAAADQSQTEEPAADQSQTENPTADEGKAEHADEDETTAVGHSAVVDGHAQDNLDNTPGEEIADKAQDTHKHSADEVENPVATAEVATHGTKPSADEDTDPEQNDVETVDSSVGDQVDDPGHEIDAKASNAQHMAEDNATGGDRVGDTTSAAEEFSRPPSEPLQDEERTAGSIQTDPTVDILAELPLPGVNSPISPLQFEDAGEGAYGERWWLKPATESEEGPNTQPVDIGDELGDQQADPTVPNDAMPAHIPGRAAVELNRQRFDEVPSVVDDAGSKNNSMVIIALVVLAIIIFMVVR